MKQVTAALIIKDDKILLTRRAASEKNGGLWEFPGGKIEAGESEFDTIIREIDEELSLQIQPLEIYDEVHYRYDHGEILLIGITCELLGGEIALTVHDKYEWVPLTELCSYQLSPADIPIAENLQNKQ